MSPHCWAAVVLSALAFGIALAALACGVVALDQLAALR